MKSAQSDLFGAPAPPALPEGFVYREAIVSAEEERALAAFFATLPLAPFEFTGGYKGNRKVLSFGWRYDYVERRLMRMAEIPPDLLALRTKIGVLGVDPEAFEQALVTEYAPGAGIGWHKDRPHFGDVVGVSLLTPCTFRFRRERDGRWERVSVTAEPRSAYLLRGPSRSEWEHSIPAVDQLRYSVTFRTMRKPD